MSGDALERSQSTYGILAMLSEGPRSGYDIKKTLSECEMFYWRESYGNIYPILRRLRDEGLVRPVDSDSGTKRRICYELTPSGWEEYLRWLRTPPTLSRFRVELLMKLRFGRRAGIDTMKAHMEHYRRVNLDEIEECRELLGEIRSGETDLTALVRSFTVEYLASFKKAIVVWCEESSAALDRFAEQGGGDL